MADATMPPPAGALTANGGTGNKSRGKNVCSSCRERKKKCDGQQPCCTSCRTRNTKCNYGPVIPLSHQRELFLMTQQQYFNSTAHQFPPNMNNMNPGATTLYEAPNTFSSLNPLPQQPPNGVWPEALDSMAVTGIDMFQPGNPTGQPILSDQLSGTIDMHSTPGGPVSMSSPGSHDTCYLPPQDSLLKLVELFFDHFYPYLPFLHRETLMRNLTVQGDKYPCPLLLYALICLSSGAHADPSVRASQEAWFWEAKSRYQATTHSPEHPLQTLQAAACLILQALLMGDHSSAGLILSLARQQAVTVGFNMLDSGTAASIPGVAAPPPRNWRELEELRRTMWMLFMLDRGMCFPVGLAHTFDERHFRVNFPSMTDLEFSTMTTPPANTSTVKFTRNLKTLVQSVKTRNRNHPQNLLHYIILSYILLGRIVEHVFSPDYDADISAENNANNPNHPNHANQPNQPNHEDEEEEEDEDGRTHTQRLTERKAVEETLIEMRVRLPLSATSLFAAHHVDYNNVVWLNCIMNTCTVLLGHKPTIPRQQANYDAYHQPQQPPPSLLGGGAAMAGAVAEDLHSRWSQCVAAGKASLALIRDVAAVNMGLLSNPHIVAPLFTCGRILVIEYLLPSQPGPVVPSHPPSPPAHHSSGQHAQFNGNGGINGNVNGSVHGGSVNGSGALYTPSPPSTTTPHPTSSSSSPAPGGPTPHPPGRDPSLQKDLEHVLLVFDRASEAYNGIGKKFRNGLIYHMRQPMEKVARIKAGGSRELLTSCGEWPQLSDEEAKIPF